MSCRFRPVAALFVQATILLTLAGCGGDDFSLGKVTGTVTCEGKPVTQGAVAFTPVATGSASMVGKPAMGRIGSDGAFELMTYVQSDGAVIGRHRVTVTFPGEELGAMPGSEEGGVLDGMDVRQRRRKKANLPKK